MASVGIVMFRGVLNWFIGGGLSVIAAELRTAYADKLNATNDADRIKADTRIATAQASLEAQTRGDMNWLPKAMRALWVAPFIVYDWKLIVYDKVLSLGVTDPLSKELIYLQGVMLVFYFFRR